MTVRLFALRPRLPLLPVLSRLMRFAIVGASGVALNTAIFWLLTSRAQLHYLLAGAVAFEAATISNYLLNNAWTFADRRTAAGLRGPGRYHTVTLGGLAISLLVLLLLASAGVPPLIANLGGIAVAMLWNFALNLRWTWREAAV